MFTIRVKTYIHDFRNLIIVHGIVEISHGHLKKIH